MPRPQPKWDALTRSLRRRYCSNVVTSSQAACTATSCALSTPCFFGPRIFVQEKALWLLASVAGGVLLVVALLPQWEPLAETPGPEPAAVLQGSFRVAVLNGCGDPRVAARMTRKARGLGIDVIHEGNAPSFGFLESLVIDRTGNLERARGVAKALGIPHTIQQISDDAYRLEEVTIIVGRDYKRLGLLEP